MTGAKTAPASFSPTPSIKRSALATIAVSKSMPTGDGCVGPAVETDGAVPSDLGLDRAALIDLALNFTRPASRA